MILFAHIEHVEVEATWGIYQRMIAAYRDPDRTAARAAMSALPPQRGWLPSRRRRGRSPAPNQGANPR